jgi:hypothetical protein
MIKFIIVTTDTVGATVEISGDEFANSYTERLHGRNYCIRYTS